MVLLHRNLLQSGLKLEAVHVFSCPAKGCTGPIRLYDNPPGIPIPVFWWICSRLSVSKKQTSAKTTSNTRKKKHSAPYHRRGCSYASKISEKFVITSRLWISPLGGCRRRRPCASPSSSAASPPLPSPSPFPSPRCLQVLSETADTTVTPNRHRRRSVIESAEDYDVIAWQPRTAGKVEAACAATHLHCRRSVTFVRLVSRRR